MFFTYLRMCRAQGVVFFCVLYKTLTVKTAENWSPTSLPSVSSYKEIYFQQKLSHKYVDNGNKEPVQLPSNQSECPLYSC